MPSPTKPTNAERADLIRTALYRLRIARQELGEAGAALAATITRRAIQSAEGALRRARAKEDRGNG